MALYGTFVKCKYTLLLKKMGMFGKRRESLTVHEKQQKNSWVFSSLRSNCSLFLFFVVFFSFFAIYSIALKLHTIAFQSDWCFLFIFRITKKEEKIHVYPLSKIASICWSHDNNQTPSHLLIIKVVSACSAICKHPRTRPEVQRLFSLLYPGYNTTNWKKVRTERTIKRE